MAAKLIPTPSQTVGPFFSLGLDRPEWNDLTRGHPQGERIVIAGRVLDGDGAPVPDAVVEIWQANAAGRYAHPEDPQTDKPLDPNFRGFGRVATDAEGRFHFTTIKPGPVPGRGNSLQAPHINVLLLSRGLLIHLHTRIYFEGEPANAPLQFRAEGRHDLGIETGARHHDECPLTHSTEPDRRDRAGRNERGKRLGSAWQPNLAREDIGTAERQHAKRDRTASEAVHDGADGAVAARRDDRFETGLRLTRQAFDLAR